MNAIARAAGFASGWAVFTLALATATRPMRLGPGFSNLLPYAAAAVLLSLAGHLVRAWLGQIHSGPQGAEPGGPIKRTGRSWLRGLRVFFSGTAACNNFLFLTVAYVIGIGITSLFVRKPAKDSRPGGSGAGNGYWRDLHLGKREADAYYRPF